MKTKKIVNSKYQIINNNHGFTLVELTIYMGLLMVMILIFTEIFYSIMENQLRSRNTANTVDDGRYIYTRFINDVERASAIVEPLNLGDESDTLVITIDGEDHTYALTGDNLTITNPTGTFQLNGYGSRISDINFTKIGSPDANETVRINFTVTGRINEDRFNDEQNFQTTAGLR